MNAEILLELKDRVSGSTHVVDAVRTVFSAYRCFKFDGSDSDRELLSSLARHLLEQPGLALFGASRLTKALLEAEPALRDHAVGLIQHSKRGVNRAEAVWGMRAYAPSSVPGEVRTVFLSETRRFPRMQMSRALGDKVRTIEPDVLVEIARDAIPANAWIPLPSNIYPIDVPEIEIESGLDMLLIDCPARNLALMPNGLGYVHNALKKTSVKFQTFDLDIVTYHRFHIARLFDEGGEMKLPDGSMLPLDPWQVENYDLWGGTKMSEYLRPVIVEAAAAIIDAAPKIVGLSIQGCNEAFSRELIQLIKEARPSTVILTGGYSCYNPDVGRRAFPDCDYMCIGEADLTVGPLVERLTKGERPRNLPGVLSRYDDPKERFIQAPMPHNLETIEFPKYDWVPLSTYRNFNGYQVTPVIASRGCRWSRCTFCAERFYWRIRPEAEFVDELEWLVDRGCRLFMFNESDLNGNPDQLLAICDEIIRRELPVKLTGQLRIHKKSDRAFFDKLHKAGFVALRFGVDGFSANTMRLQKKGYTPEIVARNLRDCHEAGIYIELNWVIGVPGETEEDIDEGIQLCIANKQYIGRIGNINPLLLVNGSVYWINPDAFGIKFRRPKEELYDAHPKGLPPDTWYSTEPYIDGAVRQERFERVVSALAAEGVPLGAVAATTADDVKSGRDKFRTSQSNRTVEERTAMLPPPPPSGAARSVRTIGLDRIYESNGTYYAAPGNVDFSVFDGSAATLPAGTISADSEGAISDELERIGPLSRDRDQPRFIRSQMGYDIYHFDGAYYAVETGTTAAPLPADALKAEFQAHLGAMITERVRLTRTYGHMGYEQMPAADASLFASPEHAQFTLLQGDDYWHAAVPRTTIERLNVDQGSLTLGASTAKHAAPELLRSANSMNICEYDGRFYGVPYGVPIEWGNQIPELIDGIVASDNLVDLEDRLGIARKRERQQVATEETQVATPASKGPQFLKTLGDYNLIHYEGLYYGIPQSFGNVDLQETNVIGMKGVIIDITQYVVENEIIDLVSMKPAVQLVTDAAE